MRKENVFLNSCKRPAFPAGIYMFKVNNGNGRTMCAGGALITTDIHETFMNDSNYEICFCEIRLCISNYKSLSTSGI